MPQNVAEWLRTEKYPDTRFNFRIEPGEKGIDVMVGPGGVDPGFRMAEINQEPHLGIKLF